jgi:flagellar basal-body rod modification protein FlgD
MVDAVQSASAAASTSTEAARNKAVVDYDAFLTLLVAQMKNQDPTEPMDSTQYMAQLASFSNVEQSVQIRETLDTILKSGFLEQAGSLIGKHISSPDGKISGTVAEVQVLDDGIIATLTNGERVIVSSGVRISDSDPG